MKKIVLIGGSGFVGQAVANQLSAAGVEVLIPTRRYPNAVHLALLPTVNIVEADVHDETRLSQLLAGADGVVNLVGILHSRKGNPFGPDFARAHVELPKKIIAACRQQGIRRLVHIGALGSSAEGPSGYLRSKAAGEAAIRSVGADLDWIILRPSVIFGRDDHFLNLFARLARSFPVLPLAAANARFQPVYVDDVARAVVLSLTTPSAAGHSFDIAGPSVYTLRELVEYVSALVGKPRPIINLPHSLGMLQAALMELAPQPLMSRDNLRSMSVDNVTDGAPLPFGLSPRALEETAPRWLGSDFSRARYYPFRRHARR